MAAQLPPSPHPLGVFSSFIAKQSESLVLREKVMSLSGDSFSINTLDGRPVLQVKGETFSLSGRKAVMDMQGNHLFTIRKHALSIPKSFYAEDPQGQRFFEVEGKFGQLSIKGNFFDTHADITDNRTGHPVARIDRKFLNAREMFSGQQTYLVTVAQGVDIAIIVAMCICLDERKNEG